MPARKAPLPKRSSRKYYDVTLRGTFETHFLGKSATSPASAHDSAVHDLEAYAKDACNGGAKITVDKKTSKTEVHKQRMQAEIRLEAKDVKAAQELLSKAFGDKVQVDDVYEEDVPPPRRGRGY
jgi:hypothetical protein